MLLKKTEYNELVKKLIILLLLILVIQLKKADYSVKINEIENEINDHDHDKYITAHKFNSI